MTNGASATELCRRHLSFAWWTLLLFLSMGVALEALHGFKIGFYLDVGSETRRLLWTLAHAHGTLLALVNVAFALTLRALPCGEERWPQLASPCLFAASALVPGGFFLGGAFVYGGDPGLGAVLTPLGAALLFVAVFLTARGVRAPTPPPS